MSCKRGGAKRHYKKKGGKSATKCYKEYLKAQTKAGMYNTGGGHWSAMPTGLQMRALLHY